MDKQLEKLINEKGFKKHQDYGYYIVDRSLIHYFDDNFTYERTKVLSR